MDWIGLYVANIGPMSNSNSSITTVIPYMTSPKIRQTDGWNQCSARATDMDDE